MTTAGLLLCGGQSLRMGRDKALLPIADSPDDVGRPETLVERVHRALSSASSEILLATSHPEPFAFLGSRSVADAIPGSGPLGGLIAGLEALTHHHVVLVCACDLPFVDASSLRTMARLLAADPELDGVVPTGPAGDEPLAAAYRPRVARVLRRAADAGIRRLALPTPGPQDRPGSAADARSRAHALAGLRLLRVSKDELSNHPFTFLNVNDPAELERARGVARDGAREGAAHR